VELTGLEPDTEYTFRVGTWAGLRPETGEFTSPDLSDAGTFKTGIPKGQREPFEMVMAGDSRGGMEEIRANMDRINANEARLWVFNGDMTNGGSQVEWDDWQDAMAPVLQSRVLMPVHGNHEIFANIFYEQYALPQEPGLPEELSSTRGPGLRQRALRRARLQPRGASSSTRWRGWTPTSRRREKTLISTGSS
jgi:hypothetical protein